MQHYYALKVLRLALWLWWPRSKCKAGYIGHTRSLHALRLHTKP